MSDVAQHPSFPETEVKLPGKHDPADRAGRADPGFLVNERFQKAVFDDHPYSFVVPDEKSISALTRADLRAFVTKYYIPNTSHLIVGGDIDVDKTFAEIEKAFGSWKSGPRRGRQPVRAETRQTTDLFREPSGLDPVGDLHWQR